MKTTKLSLCVLLMCALFSYENIHSQKIGTILKKKTEKAVEKTLDKGIEKIDGKDGKEKDQSGEVIVTNENRKPVANFINGNTVFTDNFDRERAGEFPSKWTQINGTMQNSQLNILGREEGVVQFITSSRMKPTFKNDNYLGNSFKIETQVYFHGKGNEAYTLNLMNNNDPYKAYQITIRGDGIVPAGSSSQYARMPYKLPYPGWRTIQLSFNNGILKVFYEGYQLILIPDLNKGDDKHIREFTHLELSALSRSASPATINYIKIGHKGLPLYKKLVNEGRLVFHDILFDEDSYFINSSSYPTLDRISKMLLENANTQVTIEGHTNSKGSNASNQILSENRAKAVKNYLGIKGVDANRMSTVGYGEERPISLENNEKAWLLNRRVEIVYSGN